MLYDNATKKYNNSTTNNINNKLNKYVTNKHEYQSLNLGRDEGDSGIQECSLNVMIFDFYNIFYLYNILYNISRSFCFKSIPSLKTPSQKAVFPNH